MHPQGQAGANDKGEGGIGMKNEDKIGHVLTIEIFSEALPAEGYRLCTSCYTHIGNQALFSQVWTDPEFDENGKVKPHTGLQTKEATIKLLEDAVKYLKKQDFEYDEMS
jgi:hypothetical protein